MANPYKNTLDKLSAINALSVTGHKSPLNARGMKLLKYLWSRSNRKDSK